MELVDFLQSMSGRLLRVLIGAALLVVALFWVGGAWSWLIGAVGALFVIVGAMRVCLIGPLFGVSMTHHAN